MNKAQNRPTLHKVLSMILALVMVLSLLPLSGFTASDNDAVEGYDYNIMFLDCGRKYFSVSSIKSFIDEASAAGFNYIQLAVGNDGMRFLLDDMSLTVDGTTYSSEEVSAAIHSGNEAYYNFDTDELTQSEMDTIIAYANGKGMGVIPCINTPGHMDAILDAAEALTKETCSYNGSTRTIDVTNSTAVSFTKAFLQKYINYFASKGCTLFNMGADEYANDIYTSGSMGFGQLQSTGEYSYYVTYVNEVARMIKTAGMKPMAFNDGIYFNSKTSYGTFDTDILICYWSCGWNGYNPMPATTLASMGYKLINTHGDYYWVLGKSDSQCDANKAAGFGYQTFQGSTVEKPAGSMFCIWCDYPVAGTEASVISSTSETITAFGGTLPAVEAASTVESKTVTDASSGISVTAPDLAELTVTEATDAPEINNAEKTLAYDVTPATADGNYTDSASVSIKIPTGWDRNKVRGFVVNRDNTVTTVTGTVSDGFYTFNAPHFSVMGLYQLAAASYTKTEEIELTVGGTVTVTQSNVDSSSSITGGDSSIATVSAKYKDIAGSTTKVLSSQITSFTTSGTTGVISDGNGNYLVIDSSGDISNTININEATEFTVTRTTENNKTYYTIEGSNDYVLSVSDSSSDKSLYASKESSTTWKYDGDKGFYFQKQGGSSYYLAPSWSISKNSVSSYGNLYSVSTKTTEPVKGTEITFTGVADGTTEIQVGNVLYKITVKAEDVSKVDPITVEYWITNKVVTGSDNATSKKISASEANDEKGVLFSTLVPSTGEQDGNEDVFWKGTRLTSSNKQTTEAGVDKTKAGDDFTYIRYWEKKWSFSADGKTWTDFDSSDQIVAYYLQRTTVTDEITTEVVDWGTIWSSYSDSKYVIVDFAVKYQSSYTLSPSSFPVTGKTLGFHCNDSTDLNKTVFKDNSSGKYYRSIGMIKGEQTANYEVYMITLTPTSDSPSTTLSGYSCKSNTSISYEGTEKVVWVDNEKNLGDFADESLHYTSISGNIQYSVGGEPIVPGLEVYNQQGMLVTYYVRAKATEDSLKVNYYVNGNSEPFYSYNIAVKENTTFNKDIALPDTVGKIGQLVNGSVTNYHDNTETVTSDLSDMPQIGAQYRYSDYSCTSLIKSDDLKTINLYYTFNDTKTFVADFGLPIEITPEAVNADLKDKVTNVTVAQKIGNYGTVTVNSSDDGYKVVYTLNSNTAISGEETFNITYTGYNSTKKEYDTVTWTINIIPASTVYYEDSFATFTDGSYNSQDAKWNTVTNGTTQENVTQALEALGSKQNVYGYDPAYDSSTQYSLGSAHKVTVSSTMAEDKNVVWPSATFTFTGTGFDIISLTDNTSGAIYVDVYQGKEATGTPVKRLVVNNYYGYKYDSATSTWAVDNNADTLYQIPVMKVTGLDCNQWTVVIKVMYASGQDVLKNKSYNFWLDGIRVYNPMGEDYDYTKDSEGYPQYIKLHDEIVKKTSDKTTTLFIEGLENADVTTYANRGPNNEVYLATNQSISFTLTGDLTDIESVQIGAKAPNGNTNLVVNGTAIDCKGDKTNTLTSATEMYYDITSSANEGNQVTITNTSGNILSLTNLKITYSETNKSVSLADIPAEEAPVMLMAVRAMFASSTPVVETFEPETFKVSLSKNSISAGQKATLTVKASAEVTAITVNGETYDSYTTRYERSGWGWWSAKTEYHVFTVSLTATETTEYNVVAVNAEGAVSEAETVTLTVRAAQSNWWDNVWNNFFGKWF